MYRRSYFGQPGFGSAPITEGFPALWMRTICSGSKPAVLGLYVTNAVLVPTYDKSVLRGHPQLAAYFDRFMRKDALCGEINTMISQQLGAIQVLSGIYTFRWREAGLPKSVRARYTFVLIPTTRGLRITTHHSSEVP